MKIVRCPHGSDGSLDPDFRVPHSFDQVLADRLKVMDATAIVMCRENDLPLVVFNLNNGGDLVRLVAGEPLGTAVGNQVASGEGAA